MPQRCDADSGECGGAQCVLALQVQTAKEQYFSDLQQLQQEEAEEDKKKKNAEEEAAARIDLLALRLHARRGETRTPMD